MMPGTDQRMPVRARPTYELPIAVPESDLPAQSSPLCLCCPNIAYEQHSLGHSPLPPYRSVFQIPYTPLGGEERVQLPENFTFGPSTRARRWSSSPVSPLTVATRGRVRDVQVVDGRRMGFYGGGMATYASWAASSDSNDPDRLSLSSPPEGSAAANDVDCCDTGCYCRRGVWNDIHDGDDYDRDAMDCDDISTATFISQRRRGPDMDPTPSLPPAPSSSSGEDASWSSPRTECRCAFCFFRRPHSNPSAGRYDNVVGWLQQLSLIHI